MSDTIFAVSSGAPPAAIAVIRISGPDAFAAGGALAGSLPAPRRAGLRRLQDADGAVLDTALVLAFPGPATATGEDVVELHLHGGRAVVRAVEARLGALPGLRPAVAGEFTRRALENGRIDLSQAEGLADLLAAETESARRAALAAADGMVSGLVREWTARLIALSARTEALLDFADEDDVPASPDAVAALVAEVAACAANLRQAAARPVTERLRDGFRVVFAGPPNSGKSSLLNAMAQREIAIATPIAGTTRDRLEAPVARDGIAYMLIDTAGLHDDAYDPVERIGIERAREAIAEADLVVWLGDDEPPLPAMIAVHARCDLGGRTGTADRLAASAVSGQGIAELWEVLAQHAAAALPRGDVVAFNRRQQTLLATAAELLAACPRDLLLLAEHLRLARRALGGIIGDDDIESVLDDLFGRFCVGK